MQLTNTLSLIFIALTSFASAGAHEKCLEKAPSVVKAIEVFCSKRDLMVPSNYAMSGATDSLPPRRFVQITGPCKPKQWIPPKYCKSQL